MPAKETECTEREAGKLELLSKTSSWMKLMFITPKFGADALILIVASIAINLLALALPIALMQSTTELFQTLVWVHCHGS